MTRSALLFAGLSLVAATTLAGEGHVRPSEHRVPGRYIVMVEPGADAASVADSVRNLKGRVRHTFKSIKGFSVELSDIQAQNLSRDTRVQFVEEDSIVNAATTWALDRVDQRFLPLNETYVSSGTGAGVNIYIVDTGIFADHDDFGNRVSAGFSAFDDGIVTDCNGHGTHVAGLAAGEEYGAAKGATLVPVRVLDCTGAGTASSVLAGLDWILAHHEQSQAPGVVNMSLSGSASSAVDAGVDRLLEAGLTTVVAAGNSNQDACRTSPGRVRGAITVGASTITDQRATFSNYGPCVDLFAPGTDMISTWYTGRDATATGNGTSASAPLAAGVAALLLEQYPDASPAVVEASLASQATLDILSDAGAGSPNRLLFSLIDALDEPVRSDSQLLADPSFEYGDTFWSSDICTVINPAGCGIAYEIMPMNYSPRSGDSSAVLGGQPKSFDLMSETVTIPSNISRAEVGVYLWVVTKSKAMAAHDILTIEIRDAGGRVLETLGTRSNLDANPTYGKIQFDVTRYRGQSVRIGFTGLQKQGKPTWFLLDDVTLNVWR